MARSEQDWRNRTAHFYEALLRLCVAEPGNPAGRPGDAGTRDPEPQRAAPALPVSGAPGVVRTGPATGQRGGRPSPARGGNRCTPAASASCRACTRWCAKSAAIPWRSIWRRPPSGSAAPSKAATIPGHAADETDAAGPEAALPLLQDVARRALRLYGTPAGTTRRPRHHARRRPRRHAQRHRRAGRHPRALQGPGPLRGLLPWPVRPVARRRGGHQFHRHHPESQSARRRAAGVRRPGGHGGAGRGGILRASRTTPGAAGAGHPAPPYRGPRQRVPHPSGAHHHRPGFHAPHRIRRANVPAVRVP